MKMFQTGGPDLISQKIKVRKMDDSIIEIVDSNFEYRNKYPKYEFNPSTWKILSKKEMSLMIANNLKESAKKIEVMMLLELWNLHLIDDFEISFLLEPTKFIDKNDIEENDLMKYYDKLDDFFDEAEPVNVYISYPFSVDIELKVFPITQITRKIAKILPIGYLAWQVSKLFEKLIKTKFEGLEIAVLKDLQLTSFVIFENNNFVLEISS